VFEKRDVESLVRLGERNVDFQYAESLYEGARSGAKEYYF